MERKKDLRLLFAGAYCFFAAWMLMIAQPPAMYQVLALVFVMASVPIILTSRMNTPKRYDDESIALHLYKKRMFNYKRGD